MKLVNPFSTEVMEGVTTKFISVSFSDDPVDFRPSIFNAETTIGLAT